MNKNREQGTGNREQLTEEERHEAATEEAATVGCPSLGIPKLPGCFDGTEPAGAQGGGAVPAPHKVSEEARAKLEQSVIRMRQKLKKIADLALTAEAKSNNPNVKLGPKYMENSKAIAEIRRICKQSFAEEIVLDYEWLARIMTSDHFEPECLAKAIEAEASKRQIEYPTFYTPGCLCDLAKRLQGREKPLDPTAPEMKRGEGWLFKYKHNSSCHGTYIYDRICINDARIRATLHPDNGGLENHAMIWIGDSQRCFCYCTFNTTSSVKCDYVVRGMLAGIAKRLVYHHKNLIKRKAKLAAAKQQAHDNKAAAGEVK